MKKIILGIVIINSMSLTAQTNIIAHRGFWKKNPITAQNSIQSLKNAQEQKIYGSEFDVRMTKDGILVVNHDEHHGNMIIADTDYKTLGKTNLSNGEYFPLLKDYLKQGKKDSSVKLIVEIKPAISDSLENNIVAKTLELIDEMNVKKQCEFISFSLNVCKQIKKLAPEFKVQYLNGELSPQEIKAQGLDGIDYHYSVFEKNPSWISDANALGLITNSWTVNDVDVYNKLKSQGINFVTTNIPDLLICK